MNETTTGNADSSNQAMQPYQTLSSEDGYKFPDGSHYVVIREGQSHLTEDTFARR